jgi:hypothetical protein
MNEYMRFCVPDLRVKGELACYGCNAKLTAFGLSRQEAEVKLKSLAVKEGWTESDGVYCARCSARRRIDITPQQYHAGLDKLWEALGLASIQSKDVFTLAARHLKAWKEIAVAREELLECYRHGLAPGPESAWIRLEKAQKELE